MHYAEMTRLELLQEHVAQARELLCEYRSAQYDNGTGEGKMIRCRNTATQWTDRGLRCDAHGRD